MTETAAFSKSEMMIVAAARELAGRSVCFVGVGLPNIAVNLAKRTVAPELELVYEAGVFGARPARLPLSIGDPTIVTGATAVVSMLELFGYYLQRGLIDVGFLGAAQIDRFGNINSTWIRPRPFLVGSGGGNDVASTAAENVIVATLTQQRTVADCTYVTSPGRCVQALVTDLATFEKRGEVLQVSALAPGVSFDDVRALCGWQLEPPTDEVPVLAEPTSDEVMALRRWDPRGWFLRAR